MFLRFCLTLLLCQSLFAVELDFATFFGGEYGEQGADVALDSEGNIYVIGQTRDVPASPGALYSVTGTSYDIFVLKLNPTGTQILYLAVFGGTGRETGKGITVDAEGCAYVTGWTFSDDFPVTPGAAQTTFGGGTRDAFVAKLSADGSRFVYATYLGGSLFEDGEAIAVDAAGRAVVTGTTASPDFVTTEGALELGRPGTNRSAYVTRLSADGSTLEWSALVGGSGQDQAHAVTLDADGSVWIAGSTTSADFPVSAGAYQTSQKGSDDAFVARLSADGATLEASTLLGGATCVRPLADSACDQALAVTLDAGRPILAGNTITSDFPVTNASTQGGGVAYGDAFVARFDRDLRQLELSTLLGGPSEDQATDVVTDLSGAMFVSGTTGSRNFPTTPDAVQTEFGLLDEAFLVELDPTDGSVLYATLLGGQSGDRGYALATDARGKVVISGETGSREFPVTPGVIQPELADIRNEGGDAFIAQLTFEPKPRLTSNGIVNGASLLGGVIAPGEIISLFGRAIGPEEALGLQLDAGGAVTSELGGVRVLVNGVPAPLLYVGLNQINAVVPYAAAALPVASLEVERDGFRSAPLTLRVEPSAPALFALSGSGVGQGAILNQDASVNGPDNPARRGDIVVLYATGEGLTEPAGVDGALAAEPLPHPVSEVRVSIDGLNAEILYAGGAPGLVAGVLQINARVPAAARSGAATPVSFTAGGRRSPAGVTLAIE
ncbi:MAG: hypothetical protein GC160_28580 [Acidobacteria bacterium]|nr:hypothetical protein [Acidobacteriota bacterium]